MSNFSFSCKTNIQPETLFKALQKIERKLFVEKVLISALKYVFSIQDQSETWIFNDLKYGD